MKKLLYFVFSILFFVSSCTTEDEDVIDLGYRYWPIENGHFIIYEVEEYIYDDFDNSIDTNVYQLKELTDSAEDLGSTEGTNYILFRYKRANEDSAWTLMEQWRLSDNKENGRIVLTENNQGIVKMSFPFTRGKSWDGNAMNTEDEKIYRATTYDLKADVNKISFANTATILQEERFNLIEDIFAREIYSRGIGLIYKEDKNLRLDGNGNIESGHDITWKYVRCGVE